MNPLTFQTLSLPAEPAPRAHAILAAIPVWGDEDPRFLALCQASRDGLTEPVKMTALREIIDPDSRERWLAAKRWQHAGIPVQIVPEDQVATVCLGTLLHRRHLTKSALAFLAYPLLETAWQESIARRVENLKKANVSRKSGERTIGSTVQDFADEIGVGRRTFFEAQKVHKIFATDAEYRALMEPRILAEPVGGEHEAHRPVGLGAVIAGYAGRNATTQVTPEVREQLELFCDGVGALAKRWAYWTGLDNQGRAEARQAIRTAVAAMPEGLREEWAAAIKAAKS